MKYRKKPVVVEAYRTDKEMIIHTLEGDIKASVGNYIITGIEGEQYPCKPDIFEKTYEPATNTNFDRIKAMSVEEMAKIIECPKGKNSDYGKRNCKINIICYQCKKQWLESEVQENGLEN